MRFRSSYSFRESLELIYGGSTSINKYVGLRVRIADTHLEIAEAMPIQVVLSYWVFPIDGFRPSGLL